MFSSDHRGFELQIKFQVWNKCVLNVFSLQSVFCRTVNEWKTRYVKTDCVVGLSELWLMAWTQTVTESAVLQRHILGPVLFSIFFNNPQRGDDTCSHQFLQMTPSWEEPDDRLNSRAVTQKDPGRLEELTNRNLVKFNKDKCKALHLQRKSKIGWALPGWGAAVCRGHGAVSWAMTAKAVSYI